MISKWSRTKKLYFIASEIALLFMLLGFGIVVNAQSATLDTQLSYSVSNTCEFQIPVAQWPFNFSEDWTTLWGTTPGQISLYGGIHPATTTELGAIIAFTNAEVFDFFVSFGFVYDGDYLTLDLEIKNVQNGSNYIWVDLPDTGPNRYGQFFRNGPGDCVAINSPDFSGLSTIDSNTRFTNATATGTASTTISIDVDYFLQTDEFNSGTRPDIISVNTVALGFLNDQQVSLDRRLILPLSDGPASKKIPLSHAFVDGNYASYILFWNINFDTFTFKNSSLILNFEITGGEVTNSTVTEIYNGQDTSNTITYDDCSLTSIGGCFKNAMIYVFVPQTDSLDRFIGVWSALETKPPFGYVNSVKNALESSSMATGAFSFGSLPFISQIFDPFKILLAIGLWFMYALFFMGRLDKLDI